MSKPISHDAPIRVLLVGAGGLAVPILWGLLEQWPKTHRLQVIVLDDDVVEASNLNRQVFFRPSDIGQPKAELLIERMRSLLNPATSVELFAQTIRLAPDNIHSLLSTVSFVIDACDSTETKFTINDYCVTWGLPYCYGGAVAYRGLCFLHNPLHRPAQGCLRCLFGDFAEDDYENQAASCQQSGILGAAAGHIGFLQAQLSRSFLLSDPEARLQLGGELHRFEFPDLGFHSLDLVTASDCPLGCGLANSKKLNLLGIRCPDTFLRTKLALEQMQIGESLKVVFDSEESLINVSRSVVNEGHESYGQAQKIGQSMWQKVFLRRQRFTLAGLR